MNELVSHKEIHTSWIENLAIEEINMEESGTVRINDHLAPTALLEQSSIDFMDALRDRCDVYVSKFNEYRGGNEGQGQQIRIFKISNTVNDFMLFRNSLRLIIARKANDIISIGFLSGSKEVFPARMERGETGSSQRTHDINAHIGPFHNISWRFNGEPVNMDSLVRYYLCEFIRNSAR